MEEEFLPVHLQRFETLSVDTKNKEILINGKSVGRGCMRLSIECDPPEWKIQIDTKKPGAFVSMELTFDLAGERIKYVKKETG